MRPTTSVPQTLLVALLLAACGGDSPTSPGNNDGNDGGDTGNPTTPTVKEDPSFASDIVPIFAREGCTAGGCHGSPAQAGLTLSSAPYSALVNVASSQTGEIRVIPGNANDSYLVKKLEGRASVGARMPLGGQIGATDLTNIKNWIAKGAKNN